MKVYLCSRVAYDARPFNDEVAKVLRNAGYATYVPHEQAPNNLTASDIEEGRYDTKTIFLMDYAALEQADVVVAVGRMGADCSWELGYAWGTNKPVVHVPGPDESWRKSPMLIPTLRQMQPATTETVAQRVAVAIAHKGY